MFLRLTICGFPLTTPSGAPGDWYLATQEGDTHGWIYATDWAEEFHTSASQLVTYESAEVSNRLPGEGCFGDKSHVRVMPSVHPCSLV